MRLDLIDNNTAAKQGATPIYCLKDSGADRSDIPDDLAVLMKANNFKGDAGAVLCGANAVAFGIGDGSDLLMTAAAGEKLPEGDYFFVDEFQKEEATLTCLGWLLGGYKFTKYKSSSPAVARLIAPENADLEEAKRMAASVALVRDLVNTPAGDMLPDSLEKAVRDLADEFSATFNVITGDALLSRTFP